MKPGAGRRDALLRLAASAAGTVGSFSLAGGAHAADARMSGASVSFVVYLPTRPEARQQMRDMMFAVLDAMSKEPDFVHTWAHEDMNDPDLLINYETWACSREDFIERHLKKPYRQAYEAALPAMLSGGRRIVFLKNLRGYPSACA